MPKVPEGQQSDALPGESSCVTSNSPRPGSAKRNPGYVTQAMRSSANIDHFDAEPGESSVSKKASGLPPGLPGENQEPDEDLLHGHAYDGENEGY